jgi:phage tail-like protein
MSLPKTRSYRFATAAQWASGIFARARLGADGSASPYPPHAATARAFPLRGGARAPAFGYDGNAWWRGAQGSLFRLDPGAGAPVEITAPDALARARRMATGRRVAWVAGRAAATLSCYSLDDLGHIRDAAIDGEVIDLADDGRNGAWVLARRKGAPLLLHVDCSGRQVAHLPLPGALREPGAMVWLRKASRFVLLAEGGQTLWFLGPDGAPAQAPLPLATLRPCLRATQLGSDGRGLIVLGGRDHDAYGGQWRAIVADAFGDVLDQVAVGAPVTGVSAHGEQLLVATERGAELYGAAQGNGAGTGASLEFLTPALHSPDAEDAHCWLRAELSAGLPRGTLLSLESVGTSQPALRDEATRIARDPNLPPQVRQAQLDRLLGPWSEPLLFTGSADGDEPQTLAAPLFQQRHRYLWLRLRLTAPPGAALPRLSELRVLYPDMSLMQQLPAIFRRDDQPHDFLRSLVGVLETTTQDLDRKIGSIGSLLHPQSASGKWLDFVARWLGLPWDDGLDEGSKRRLLLAGHRILALRGTRAGLEALLASLFPDQPPIYRIRDFSTETRPAMLGGGARAGSALPALLGGLPRHSAVLGRKAILGQLRLPCEPDAACAAQPWEGLVRIDMRASQQERAAWEPWLAALVDAVMPLSARASLRWRPPQPASGVLGEDTRLDAPGNTTLGSNAILGDTRLAPDRPITLSESGIDPGFGLQ